MPRSEMRPSSSTRISSASFTVEMRCATTMLVRSRITPRRRFRISASVYVSTAESASSRMRMRGSFATARAIAVRCFCPPERVTPRSPIIVS